MSALDRFVRAQEGHHEQALAELKAGRKTSHWIWFVLPQLRGLGRSAMAREYGIAGREQLVAQQDTFYGSDVWRSGPRQALVDCLDDYLNTLLWLPEEAVEAIRANNGMAA